MLKLWVIHLPLYFLKFNNNYFQGTTLGGCFFLFFVNPLIPGGNNEIVVVTFGMAWTTKGIGCLNPTTINAATALSRLLLHTLLIDSVQIFANIFYLSSKYIHEERNLFHKVLLMLLTHQHHLAKFYLTMTKMALEIFQVFFFFFFFFFFFQVITCTLGMTYNVNVKHTESLMLNMVVSLAVYKSFFD